MIQEALYRIRGCPAVAFSTWFGNIPKPKEVLISVTGIDNCFYIIKVNKWWHIVLFVFSGSIKKFFSIDRVNIYLFSLFFRYVLPVGPLLALSFINFKFLAHICSWLYICGLKNSYSYNEDKSGPGCFLKNWCFWNFQESLLNIWKTACWNCEIRKEPAKKVFLKNICSQCTLSLPSKIIRKPLSFLKFSGGRERVHWEQMG